MFKNARTVILFLFLLPIVITSTLIFTKTQAKYVSNTKEQCVDLLIVFERGSSQNSNHQYLEEPFGDDFKQIERESGKFFETFKEQLDRDYPHVDYKAVSIHNFPNKYSENGYRAVPAFNWADLHKNAINADASWYPGDYRQSVDDGVTETIGYVKDEIARCPNQKIVMGGYSQGAQVLGDSLFHFTEPELAQIEGVALFGDPKFVASSDNPWNPFDKKEVYPWKRGTAKDNERGSADARIPYVPESMNNKTLSWCFDDDFVCSGFSGVRKQIGEGHSRYSYFGVQQAAIEIVQTIAPKLYAIERAKGGVDKGAGTGQPIPYTPSSKPIDLMFLVNTSYNIDDVLGQLRLYTPQVMTTISKFFNTARYAIADFNELSYGPQPIYLPQINIRQNFKAYSGGSSNLEANFVRNLAWGGSSGGGIDPADPHVLAIEKVATTPSWQQNATKHIILITDRPMKETYTYNICDPSIRIGLEITKPNVCLNTPSVEEASSADNSALCDTVWNAMIDDICKQEFNTPTSTRNITRTMQDAINISQANNITVSIVVPHPITQPINKELAEKQLEYFAKATGGLFIKYGSFSTASYSDMMWQVLNHQPEQLSLAYKDALSVLGEYESLKASKHVLGKTNIPIVMDVSGSTKTYSNYKWDFNKDGVWDEETVSPTIQHTFDHPINNGLLRVVGIDESGAERAGLTLPLTIENYDEPPIEEPEVLNPPTNINATVDEAGSVTLSWESGQPETAVVAIDPASDLPVHSTPAEQGSMVFSSNELSGNEIVIWVISELGSSERIPVPIEKAIIDNEDPPTDETPNNEQPIEEPVKLIVSESDPWSQYLGESDQESDNSNKSITTAAQNQQTALQANRSADMPLPEVQKVAGASTDQKPVEDEGVTKPNSLEKENTKPNNLFIFLMLTIILMSVAFCIVRRKFKKPPNNKV